MVHKICMFVTLGTFHEIQRDNKLVFFKCVLLATYSTDDSTHNFPPCTSIRVFINNPQPIYCPINPQS